MELRRLEEVLSEREEKEPGITALIAEKLEMLVGPAAGRQAGQNIREERLVYKEEWDTLIDAVRVCTDNRDVIHEAVRGVMSNHKLKGPPTSCPPTTVFGRALVEKDLAQTFVADGKWGTLLWAKRSIAHAKTLDDVDDLRVWWADFALGKYVMWATFNAEGHPPFSNLPPTADGIRAALGLSKMYEHEPLLLLEYTLEAGKAIIPRVTEAYAGPTWMHYFRPAGLRERKRGYGRTFPWDELAEQNGVGEPEIVHEPITGHRLTAAIVEKL
jgi:hypothetical protein